MATSTGSGEQLGALPKPSKNLDGESHARGDNYQISVSNRQGYLSHVQLKAVFDVPPDDIFAIFTAKDNSHLFRDIKAVAGRKVVKQDGAIKVVEVEQIGEIKVLWITRAFSTFMEVIEDRTDPANLSVEFRLQKSDVLDKFHGKWTLKPLVDPVTGKVTTDSVLEQDVSPKGVPPAMKHIPVLGGMLRGISVRAVQRITEDVKAAVKKLLDGQTLEQLLNPTADPTKAVKSFAVDEDSDEEGGNQQEEGAVSVRLDVAEDGTVKLVLS